MWEFLRSEDCSDNFVEDSSGNFFPRTCCEKHKKHDKREPGLFKEEFRCTEMLCLCSKTYCCYDAKSNKYKFSSKGLNKRTFEDSGDGPMAKYQKVLIEQENVTSTNRVFRTFLYISQLHTFESSRQPIRIEHDPSRQPRVYTHTRVVRIEPMRIQGFKTLLGSRLEPSRYSLS